MCVHMNALVRSHHLLFLTDLNYQPGYGDLSYRCGCSPETRVTSVIVWNTNFVSPCLVVGTQIDKSHNFEQTELGQYQKSWSNH